MTRRIKGLPTHDVMKLDTEITDSNGTPLYLINPSASKDFIYFRLLKITQNKEWISDIGMYDKIRGQFSLIDCPPHMENLEDLRIFDYKDRIWFVAYKRNKEFRFETYLGYFDDEGKNIEAIVATLASPTSHVKNVVPLIHDDGIHLVDVHTWTIYTYKDNNISEQQIQNVSSNTPFVYGSTQFIPLNESRTVYGALVHETLFAGGEIFYNYRWIEIDPTTWTLVTMGSPFILYRYGLVFVTHIQETTPDTCQIMFGYNDKCAYQCTVSLQDLRSTTHHT